MRQFVWPNLQANALYQGAYPLATALARPLIAQLLVEVANRERADAVAHGCTGKGNDQVRFDVAVHALDPQARGGRADARRHGPLARPGDRVRAGARHRDPRDQEVALFGRREPVGPLDRDRHPRGSLGDAAGRRLRVDRRTRADAPDVPTEIDHRLRGWHARVDRRRAVASRWSWWNGSMRSVASTASDASTTSRIASSASRAARSTRHRLR